MSTKEETLSEEVIHTSTALSNLIEEVFKINHSVDYSTARGYTNKLVKGFEDVLLACLAEIVPLLDEHTNEVILRPQEDYDNLMLSIVEDVINGEKKVDYRNFITSKVVNIKVESCMSICKQYYRKIIDCFLHVEEHLATRNKDIHMLNGVAVNHIGSRINMIVDVVNTTTDDLAVSIKPMLFLHRDEIVLKVLQDQSPKIQKKVERALDKTLHKKEQAKLKEKLDPNLYDYKELNRMAKEEGFAKIRQKGDHGIFKRFDGTVVVIPQGRDIGKGLSIKIQKDMKGE